MHKYHVEMVRKGEWRGDQAVYCADEVEVEIARLQAEVEMWKLAHRLAMQDNIKQQSELTKARELFVRLLPLHGYSSELTVAVNDFMQANQSEPADKGGE